MKQPESHAREDIDRLLQAAGWSLQDYRAANIHASRGVAISDKCHEATKLQHYWLEVDAAVAPPRVREPDATYGESSPRPRTNSARLPRQARRWTSSSRERSGSPWLTGMLRTRSMGRGSPRVAA